MESYTISLSLSLQADISPSGEGSAISLKQYNTNRVAIDFARDILF